MAWCAQVTVVPEVSRISVLSSGKCHGSSVTIPDGGHCPIDASLGNSLKLKYAQNHATKNITSEAMNSTMPKRRPSFVTGVCSLSTTDSRITSRHHPAIV